MGCCAAKELDQHPWPESLGTALESTIVVDAAWLADLADSGGILPRCQDVPDEAKVKLEEMLAWDDHYTLPLLVISYPWLGRLHPDVNGEQLRRLAFVLKAFAKKATAISQETGKVCRVGAFWDYSSLPQRSMSCGPDEDDRSPADKEIFSRALTGINVSHRTHLG